MVPSTQVALSRAGGQDAAPLLATVADPPDPVTTPNPSKGDSTSSRSERTGIVTTKINNAALVLSRDGVHPIVITAGTRIMGRRTSFGAITRLDSVRANGQLTQSGALVADVIEVTNIASSRQVHQVNALGTGYLMRTY